MEPRGRPPVGDPRPATLPHLGDRGEARMVDVSGKDTTRRVARASGAIRMTRAALDALVSGRLPKGDALAVARVAGIQAAKLAPTIIPLAHPLPLEHVGVEVTPDEELPFAGHPTLGTAFVMVSEGRVTSPATQVVAAGEIPVEVDVASRVAWMTQLSPEFGPVFDDRGLLARATGLAVGRWAICSSPALPPS